MVRVDGIHDIVVGEGLQHRAQHGQESRARFEDIGKDMPLDITFFLRVHAV